MAQKLDRRTISRKLRPKQRRFIAEYTDPSSPNFGNGTRSAIEAGYSAKAAAPTASYLLRNPNVQGEMTRCLEQAGATKELRAQRVRDALDAQKVIYFCTKSGKLIAAPPQPDYRTQLKAVELGAKIDGDFAPEVGINLNFNLSRRIAEARQRSKTPNSEAQPVGVEDSIIEREKLSD